MGEVLAKIGHAVWQAQVLERAVVYHQVMVYQLPLGEARASAASAFDKAEWQTLGQLLRSLNAQPGVDGALIDRLDNFREERNWLVHHSRHGNEGAVHRQLIALSLTLKVIAGQAVRLATEVQDATDAHVVKNAIMTTS